MFSFFAGIKNYLIIGAILALVTTATVLAFQLKTSEASLATATKDLGIAEGNITTLNGSIETLKTDIATKESLNLKLTMQLAVIEDDYKINVTVLNNKIDELMTERSISVVQIDKTQYIKETYVEKATEVVLASMWDTYCKLDPKCSVGATP